MKRVFGIGREKDDWTNDCTVHVDDGKKYYVTAKSVFCPDEDTQYTLFHPYILDDKKLFSQTLIHEICECDLIAILVNNIVILLNNEDTGWQSFATVTHYCTVHALDEPTKEIVLPW